MVEAACRLVEGHYTRCLTSASTMEGTSSGRVGHDLGLLQLASLVLRHADQDDKRQRIQEALTGASAGVLIEPL